MNLKLIPKKKFTRILTRGLNLTEPFKRKIDKDDDFTYYDKDLKRLRLNEVLNPERNGFDRFAIEQLLLDEQVKEILLSHPMRLDRHTRTQNISMWTSSPKMKRSVKMIFTESKQPRPKRNGSSLYPS